MSDLLIPVIAVAMILLLTYFIPNMLVKVLLVVAFIGFIVFAGFNAADTQENFKKEASSYVSNTPSMKAITDGLK